MMLIYEVGRKDRPTEIIVISLHHSLGRLTEEGHEGSELKKYSTEYICAKSLQIFQFSQLVMSMNIYDYWCWEQVTVFN